MNKPSSSTLVLFHSERARRALLPGALTLCALLLAAAPASSQVPDWPDEPSLAPRIEERIEERSSNYFDELVPGAVVFNTPGFEERLEEQLEEQIAEEVVEAVEDDTAEVIAEEIEDTVQESVESIVEDVVENSIEETISASVEDMVEGDLEQAVAQSFEADIESGVEAGVEASLEANVEAQVADGIEDRLETEIDQIIDGIENDFEVDESRIHRDQWLVMGDPEVFEQLAKEGYLFDTITDLPGMGMRLAEVAAPASFDISEVRKGVIDVVGKDRAEIDLNHIYTAGTQDAAPIADSMHPRAAIAFPEDIDSMPLRIGMVDSGVDTAHPALEKAGIETRSFVAKGADIPEFHGTAIASILVANSDEYRGLAPTAQVYAAAVFENHDKRGEVASTVSLVRALDWLITSDVDVVNISLAGPPNRLLETALNRASEQGVMVLAAAGNAGPVAEPMYPAAYDSVVAITAVDRSGQVYRLANRGRHLDLAAPGVDLVHARAGGGYSASSGTSFAVPFAATAAARLLHLEPGSNTLQDLHETAKDLGPPGRDEIYGYGLLQAKSS